MECKLRDANLQTLPRPPYTIGYEGALFREYPGPWQVMYKQSTGVYACLAERPNRYNLGEFKEELMERLGLNTEAKGSPLEFMRKGYRVRLFVPFAPTPAPAQIIQVKCNKNPGTTLTCS